MSASWILPKGYSAPVWIGHGGFGDVYRLRSDILGREVAWKLFHTGTSESHITEARKLSQLKSAVVPQIFRMEKWKSRWFLEMEWIPGISLAEAMHVLPQKLEIRALVFLKILESLQTYHNDCGSHGDLQPSNILLPAKRNVMLLDPAGAGWQAMGTPKYLAPELASQKGIPSLSTDYYSIAVVGKEWMGGLDSQIPWDLVLSSSGERGGGMNGIIEYLTKRVTSRTTILLDQMLENAYAIQMASKCADSALRGVAKFPEQALALCQEALSLDPSQAKAIELLSGIQLKSKPWKRTPIILVLLLSIGIAAGLWLNICSEDTENSKENGKSRIQKEPSLLLPNQSESGGSFRNAGEGFREGHGAAIPDSGWLLIPKNRDDCVFHFLNHSVNIKQQKIALPAGQHRIAVICSSSRPDTVSFTIHPFAETILPFGK